MALKIVKASTILNSNIPRTSLIGTEKTAKVTEESRDTSTESDSIINHEAFTRINQASILLYRLKLTFKRPRLRLTVLKH